MKLTLMGRSFRPQRYGRVARVLLALALLFGAAYLLFASAVLLVLGLTDVQGFVSDARAITAFAGLVLGGAALVVLARRALRDPRTRAE